MGQDQPESQAGPANSPPVAPLPVVAFDFDGTLTVRDSYTAFLKWRAGPRRHAAGMIRLIPAALAYLVHRDRGRIKAAATREFLRGVPRERLEADALAFAERFSRSLLRPDALATWMRWRGEPVRLAIVTASPELIVAPFARDLGADVLIGTQLVFDGQDRVTGAFATPNCRGPEKIVRLKAAFGPDFELKAAYGDTGGDREMLAAAELPGYRVFKGTP
ncbi:MAG TPA: HAD-IB family hydrolase [Phenylobacterium sp.]|jgi:phosphatidylglycerophosphatase C|uniref:HAD-IB family hydrolase n=1 Tax=Phenylobacterium sp. TaxID=1871053 RepID=UPI002D68F478|nr:HAD-IB family hydrolase [Phenylobacterium sp.]HZZ68759.1 HAD-IB family hydrolase [Phenylobacterium sp.]